MTREEALKVVEETDTTMLPSWQVKNIINAIYDDLETRTCENCKHSQNSWIATDGQDVRESQYPPMLICNKIEIKEYLYPTFGCNKFEREED